MKRNNRNLLKNNLKRLFEKGYFINENICINTSDFDFKKYLNKQIKDVFELDLIDIQEQDPKYVEYHFSDNEVYKNIKRKDLISNWWRYGNKNNKKLKYLTLTTPHLISLNENILDLEIAFLMEKHYHKIFGYGSDFYIESKFYKIKNSKYYELLPDKKYGEVITSYDKIKIWIENNKESKEYLFYKNLIVQINEKNLLLQEPLIYKSNIEDDYFVLIIPFFYDKTYLELFENFDKIKQIHTTDYLEEHIEKYLLIDNNTKVFFKNFIPYKEKNKYIKRKKFKFKKS